MEPRNEILQGHVLNVLEKLPSDYADVVVTSPPYWGLRDYGNQNITIWDEKKDCNHIWGSREKDFKFTGGTNGKTGQHSSDKTHFESSSSFCCKCGAWKGQLGLEPHPQMFINHLVQIFSEVRGVLKPKGSCWIVIGDTYFGGKGQSGRKDHNLEQRVKEGRTLQKRDWTLNKQDCPQDLAKQDGKWLQPKQKMLIPERFAIAMQEDGWLLRNTVIWHKVNHMPESCRDRLTRSWESVFFFVKDKKYYFNLDAIRKPYPPQTVAICQRNFKSNAKVVDENFDTEKHQRWAKKVVLKTKHDKAIKREGNFSYTDPLHTKAYNPIGANPGDVWRLTTEGFKEAHFATFPQKLVKRILKCAAPKNGLVLDPFCGSGTTLYVAHKMGLDWLGIDLNPEYCEMANKRILSHGKVRLDKYVLSV